MPIANRCKYFNDGRVLERVHTDEKCVTIETWKDEVAATRHPHSADETLHAEIIERERTEGGGLKDNE